MVSLFGWILYFLLLISDPFLTVLRRVASWAHRRQPSREDREAPYWMNCIGNQFTCPMLYAKPTTFDELRQTILEAVGQRRHVRAVGSGHSFSDVAVTDDCLLDMHGLNRVLAMNPWLRRASEGAPLVRVESGIRIRDLNDQLHERKLALPNMGSYDVQTISGAVSTGTHGSGQTLGPLGEYVVSVELLGDDGILRIIEPASGISDPDAFAQQRTALTELVQDDDLFHSVVIAMGCMGVVYAYTLAVRDAFRLHERRRLALWDEVRQLLIDGEPAKWAHFEVLVNPYLIRGKRWCLVTERMPTTEPPKGRDARSRNPTGTFLTHFRIFDKIALWLITRVPAVIPWLVHYALKALVDPLYIDDSFRVFNLGDANLVPAYSSELAFPMTPRAGSPLPAYLAAIERLFELAGQECKHGRYHTVPVALRFVRASRHYLAPQYGRDTCMMEIPLLLGSFAGWDMLRYLERRLASFDHRPHWGQAHFLVGIEQIAAMYQRLPEWLAAYRRLNPRGTFDNVFTEHMGFRGRDPRAELEVPGSRRQENGQPREANP